MFINFIIISNMRKFNQVARLVFAISLAVEILSSEIFDFSHKATLDISFKKVQILYINYFLFRMMISCK